MFLLYCIKYKTLALKLSIKPKCFLLNLAPPRAGQVRGRVRRQASGVPPPERGDPSGLEGPGVQFNTVPKTVPKIVPKAVPKTLQKVQLKIQKIVTSKSEVFGTIFGTILELY